MIKRNGFAQIPLMIALLLMAIAIPVVTKVIDNSRDTRNLAAGNNVSECSKDSDCGSKAECAYCMKSGTTFKCVRGCTAGQPTFGVPKPTAKPTSKGGSTPIPTVHSSGGAGVCTKCLDYKCVAWDPTKPYPGDDSCKTDTPLKACIVGGCSIQGATQACTTGGSSGLRTCNIADGIISDCLVWSACKASTTSTPPPLKACVVGGCSTKGATQACTSGGTSGVRTCNVADGIISDCLVWSACKASTTSTPPPLKACIIGGCSTQGATQACTTGGSSGLRTCNVADGIISGCLVWSACKASPVPIVTGHSDGGMATPTQVPGGGGGGGTTPLATPTKTSGGGGGGGTCTNECPSSDGVLRSCDPVEGHSICNAVGRIESCGGQKFCCPTVGGAWTTDMTKCPVATPTVVAGTEPVLKFRMAFYGINTAAACALSKDLPLSVIVRNNDGTNKTYTGVIATKVDNTSGNLAYYDVTLRLVGFKQTGKFSVFVKSPKHLQVKYGVNNQGEYYNKAGGELDGMTSDPATTPVFSFEKYPLLAGDVTGPDGKQDGVVDGRDFALVKVETVKRTEVSAGGYMLSDLNANCKMESQDLSILMISLSVKQGQLY